MTCPNCRSLKTGFFFEAQNFHGTKKLSEEKFVILKCLGCGLVFPRVIPGKKFYKKYYPKTYHAETKFLLSMVYGVYQVVYFLQSRFFCLSFFKKRESA